MMKQQCARNQDQVINNCKVQWLGVFYHKLFPSLWNNKTWWTIWSLLTWFKKMDGLVGSWECLLYCSRSHCSEVHLFRSLCELLSKMTNLFLTVGYTVQALHEFLLLEEKRHHVYVLASIWQQSPSLQRSREQGCSSFRFWGTCCHQKIFSC